MIRGHLGWIQYVKRMDLAHHFHPIFWVLYFTKGQLTPLMLAAYVELCKLCTIPTPCRRLLCPSTLKPLFTKLVTLKWLSLYLLEEAALCVCEGEGAQWSLSLLHSTGSEVQWGLANLWCCLGHKGCPTINQRLPIPVLEHGPVLHRKWLPIKRVCIHSVTK